MITINLGDIWQGTLPPGGTFAAGGCGGGTGGPAPDPETGDVTFTCADVGNTYAYSYSVGTPPCDACNFIEITIHDSPCLTGQSWAFCRYQNDAGTVVVTRIVGPPGGLVGGIFTLDVSEFVEGCCAGGAYPDKNNLEYSQNGGAYSNANKNKVYDLKVGGCDADVNEVVNVSVRRIGMPDCDDGPEPFSIKASPIYGDPMAEPAIGELCVGSCASVNFRQFIQYPGAVDPDNRCLLQAGPPPTTNVLFTLQYRAVGAPTWQNKYTGLDIKAQWGLLDGINICDQQSSGCLEWRMQFTFQYTGAGQHNCLTTDMIGPFTICIEPPTPAGTSKVVCNDFAQTS